MHVDFPFIEFLKTVSHLLEDISNAGIVGQGQKGVGLLKGLPN